MSNENVYQHDINILVECFINWMSNFNHQRYFHSAQEAYKRWLWSEGFDAIGDNYTSAVAVTLAFLSRCIANPINRRYLSNPPGEPEEFTILQVNVPEDGSDSTYWEFLTEANFHVMYRGWHESRSA